MGLNLPFSLFDRGADRISGHWLHEEDVKAFCRVPLGRRKGAENREKKRGKGNRKGERAT
jgi:hypothetical protein